MSTRRVKKTAVFGVVFVLACLMVASVGYGLDTYEEGFESTLTEEWSTVQPLLMTQTR